MLTDSDRKYDPYQRTRTPARGEQISSHLLRKIVYLILNHIKPGRGIQIESRGENTYIHVADNGRGFGGMGAGTWMKTATTKAGLEEPVSEVWFGRVTAGAQKGMVCVRNPDNDGWDAINFFE